MKCEEASRFLSPYLDSELDPKTSFEISAHCDQCPFCRDRFDAERRIERSLAVELKKSEARDAELWRQARARVLRPRGGRAKTWAIGLLGFVAAAMSLAVYFRQITPP